MSDTATLGKKPLNLRWLGVTLVLTVCGLVGTHMRGLSSAATYSNNPRGAADYCTLTGGNVTTIYGWSYDPQAPAGAYPYIRLSITNGPSTGNVPSDISTYRVSQINAYLNTNYPGAPQPGVYGWKVQVTNLYKGTSHILSGTVLNYGVGTDVALAINNHYVDGDTTKPYFPGGAIPDVCLTPVPEAPLPITKPAPTPTPVPKPAPVSPKPVTPAAPSPTSDADGSVTVGTTSAVITIPAGNATSVHVLYGAEPTQPTPDQATNGGPVAVKLTNLSAKHTYKYQIVRTLGSQTTTSPAAQFTTNGYSLVLSFTDKNNKPVSGIEGNLNGMKATSEKNGKLQFDDLDAGKYNPSFIYKGHTFSQSVTIASDTKSTDGETIKSEKKINVDNLKLASSHAPAASDKHGMNPLLIAGGATALVAIGVCGWFSLRYVAMHRAAKRIKRAAGADIIDTRSHAGFMRAAPPPEPRADHMGVSLKEMVLQAMQEEAAKKPKDDEWRPPTAGA